MSEHFDRLAAGAAGALLTQFSRGGFSLRQIEQQLGTVPPTLLKLIRASRRLSLDEISDCAFAMDGLTLEFQLIEGFAPAAEEPQEPQQ